MTSYDLIWRLIVLLLHNNKELNNENQGKNKE